MQMVPLCRESTLVCILMFLSYNTKAGNVPFPMFKCNKTVMIRCHKQSSPNEVAAFQVHLTGDPEFLPQESNKNRANPPCFEMAVHGC